MLAFVASRLVVGAALWVAPLLAPGYDRSKLFLDWDAQHYFYIAQNGYPPLYPPEGGYLAHTAFFPLLPWLTRALDVITPFSLRFTAFAVANLTALAAVVAVWLLARDTFASDERKATNAVVLLVMWPASIAFSMFYSDALFIALAAACLLALRHEHWVWAGVAAMFATATRPNAIALGAACAWAALTAIRKRRDYRALIAPALVPLGMLAYFVYLQVALGDFFMWFEAEEVGWGGGFDFGRHFVVDLVVEGLRHPTARLDLLMSGAAGLLGIALLVWAIVDRMPIEQILFAGVVLVMALGASFGASIPRYVMDAFPLVFAPAARLTPNGTVVSAAFSAGLLALFSLLVMLTRLTTP